MNPLNAVKSARRSLSRILWLAAVIAAPGFAAQPPNILLLLAEDLSPRLGAYGDPLAVTPNLDALAQNAITYTRAFTTAGVCAPSRASLITGQHQISFGAQHMRTSTGPLGQYYALPPAHLRAFPELLRQSGYYTFTDRKLDYQFSGVGAGTGPFTIWDADGAADTAWQNRNADQPFFGLINLMETHESGVMRTDVEPYSKSHARTIAMRRGGNLIAAQITDPTAVNLPPYYPDLAEVRRDVARHYDNIAAMDQRVGRILKALQKDGLARNTIIIWATDHGDGLPRAKRELYDSGLHVPLLVAIPGEPARTDTRLVSFVDLAPTILDFANVSPPAYLHGQSIFAAPREYIFASRDRIDEVPDRQRAVRDARFKYIRSDYPELPGGHPLTYRDNLEMVRAMRASFTAGTLTPAQAQWFTGPGVHRLYDTHTDPHELNNLASAPEHETTLARLSQALDRFLIRVGDWGTMPETKMRTQLLDADNVPVTPVPFSLLQAGHVRLISPIGASVGYRATGAAQWQLYRDNASIRINDYPRGLEAKSVRYGWQESKVITVAGRQELRN